MRIGWSSSVLARLRWRLLPPFTLIALATLGTGIGLSVLLSFLLGGATVTGPVADFGWLLVVVLLTTPLQSAAEEYLFRGYLSQAIAGWIRRPAVGRRGGRRGHRRALLPRARPGGPADLPGPVRVRPGRVGRRLADRWAGGGDRAARGQQRAGLRPRGGAGGGGGHRRRSRTGAACSTSRSACSRWPRTSCSSVAPRAGSGRRRTPPRRTCGDRPCCSRRRSADPPLPGGCHPARSRRVSSSAAPRGATHGVWGNWQPDGFWFR